MADIFRLSQGRSSGRRRRCAPLGVENLEERLALDANGLTGLCAVADHVSHINYPPDPIRVRVAPLPAGADRLVVAVSGGGLGSNPNPEDPGEPHGPGGPFSHVLATSLVDRVMIEQVAGGGSSSAMPGPEDDGSGPTFPPGYVGPNPGPVSSVSQQAAALQVVRSEPQPQPWTPAEVPGAGPHAGF